jgi:hypothetical protein
MRSRAILPKLLLLLAFGCFAMATAVRAADENLAPDADFESDPSSSWFGRGPCTFTRATDASHSPTHALKIASGTSSLCRWLSEIPAIRVNPGESYDVSAWLRTAGSQAAGVLSVKFWNAAGGFIGRTVYAPQALFGTRDWTRLSLSVTAPDAAAFVRVELRLKGPGTLWADDIEVVAGPPVAKTRPVVKGIVEVGETVRVTFGRWTGSVTAFAYQWFVCSRPDGDCEEIPGATSDTYTLTPAELGQFIRARVRATASGRTGEALTSARGPVLQERPTSGNLARNVDVELDPAAYYFTNGPCDFDWTTSASHSPTHALRTISETSALCRWFTKPTLIPVQPGSQYTVSAWFRTADVNGNARLGINFWTRERNFIAPTILSNRTVTGTQDWTNLEVQALAPPGAGYVRVELRLSGPGTLWADDLSVTRTGGGGPISTTSTSVTSTSSSSSSSSTGVPTTSTTSTTFPGGPCCNGDRFLSFSRVAGAGDCGDVRSNAGLARDIECGGLYSGGGSTFTPLPVPLPDAGTFVTTITGCTGPVATVGSTASPDTGSNGSCTTTGCFFGPPLAVPNPLSTPVGLCVLTRVSAPASGTVDCSTGATDLSLPLGAIIYLTGDTSTDLAGTIPGIQPCPLCSDGTCIAGPNHGKACTPGTTALSESYPTSLDCPPDPMFDIGTLPLSFALTTGSLTWTATVATNDTGDTLSSQNRVFAGFCRDSNETGAFQLPGTGTPKQCWENGMAVGPACVEPLESCEQRSNGAFGPTGGANATITVIGSAASSLGGPAPATLVSIFAIPPSLDATVDASQDLPGPGAIAIQGTAQSCAVANPCP